jgi:hypothetical protein
MSGTAARLAHIGAELRRRKVWRTAAAYASVALVIALAVAELYDVLLLPEWTPRLVIVLLAAGLPVALALSWSYEARPEQPAASMSAEQPALERAGPDSEPAVTSIPESGARRQHRRLGTTDDMTCPADHESEQRRGVHHELVQHELVITADVCRQLDRSELDARIVGDYLHYCDNHAASDVLVCYLHNFGLDHHAWTAVLEQSPYRGVAPTLYGFEAARSGKRCALSLPDHLTLLRYFIQQMLQRHHPEFTVLAGFSSGADVGFHLLREPTAEPALVDGFLALGPNLSLDTCFASGALAQESTLGDAALLTELRKAGAGSRDLAEWLTLHEYLVDTLKKFHPDLTPLRRHGRDITRPFRTEHDVFARWFRDISEKIERFRCVFADTEMERAPAQRLILEHLATGILGPHFREGSIVIEPESDHFALKAPATVNRHLAAVVDSDGRVSA